MSTLEWIDRNVWLLKGLPVDVGVIIWLCSCHTVKSGRNERAGRYMTLIGATHLDCGQLHRLVLPPRIVHRRDLVGHGRCMVVVVLLSHVEQCTIVGEGLPAALLVLFPAVFSLAVSL